MPTIYTRYLTSNQVTALLRTRQLHPDWSIERIAFELDIDTSTVRLTLSKHNLLKAKETPGIWALRYYVEHPGTPLTVLAKKFDVAVSHLSSTLKRYGVASPKEYNKYVKSKQIADLRKAHPDWTQQQIATRVGVSKSHVWAMLKEHGLPTGAARRSPEENRAEVLRVQSENPDWSMRKIATAAGLSDRYVIRTLREAGIGTASTEAARRAGELGARKAEEIHTREREKTLCGYDDCRSATTSPPLCDFHWKGYRRGAIELP